MGYVGDGPKPQLEVGDISTKDVTATGDLTVDTNTLYVDSTNNRVGVGTVSPNKNLEIKNSTSPTLRIGDGTRHFEILGGSTTQTAGIGTGYGSAFTFNINSTEKARLDASGNLLVGTTDTTIFNDNADEYGFMVEPTGQMQLSANNATMLYLNRQNGDGSIIDFRKDGSTVGSIGGRGSTLYVGSGDTNLKFIPGTDKIHPATTDGADRDNAITLGDPTVRFKDLYLSGGVYLGGTGSANKLDDYEEGTFTPTYLGSSSNPSVTYNSQTSGSYVKIGRQVIAKIVLRTNSVSGGSGSVYIGGLPFTANTSSGTRAGTLNIGYSSQWVTAYPQAGYINSGQDYVVLTVNTSSDARSGLDQNPQVSNMQTGTNDNFIMATLIYET